MARSYVAASTQYLSIASALLSTYPSSFACWFKPTTVSVNHVLMDVGSTTGNSEILLWANTSNKVLCRDADAASSDATSVASISSGVWYHCVGVHVSTISRLIYLNNVSASNAVSRSPGSLNRTVVGARFLASTTATLFANGAIAYPAIWNIDLSVSDVNSLFLGASPKIIRPGNLKAYLKCTGGTSPEPDFPASTTWTLNGSPVESVNPLLYFP